jgi:hypothetical protein
MLQLVSSKSTVRMPCPALMPPGHAHRTPYMHTARAVQRAPPVTHRKRRQCVAHQRACAYNIHTTLAATFKALPCHAPRRQRRALASAMARLPPGAAACSCCVLRASPHLRYRN